MYRYKLVNISTKQNMSIKDQKRESVELERRPFHNELSKSLCFFKIQSPASSIHTNDYDGININNFSVMRNKAANSPFLSAYSYLAWKRYRQSQTEK